MTSAVLDNRREAPAQRDEPEATLGEAREAVPSLAVREATAEPAQARSETVAAPVRNLARFEVSPSATEPTKIDGESVSVSLAAASSSSNRNSRLRGAMVELSRASGSTDSGDWLDAASRLKRDALAFRRTTLSRHADVLLALSDALTFTNPTDRSLPDDAGKVLRHGLALLREPYINESEEEGLLVDLMSNGWKLGPAVENAREG